jgi:hypothetical protein
MRHQKAVALTALMALAIGTLSPVASIAAAKRAVSVKGTSFGTLRFDPATGELRGDVKGKGSRLGKFKAKLRGSGGPEPDGTFAGSGTTTIRTAAGDRLRGKFTMSTSELAPDGHTAKVVITITGGSGEFAGAHGKLIVICVVGPPSQVEGLVVTTAECKWRGKLSY